MELMERLQMVYINKSLIFDDDVLWSTVIEFVEMYIYLRWIRKGFSPIHISLTIELTLKEYGVEGS